MKLTLAQTMEAISKATAPIDFLPSLAYSPFTKQWYIVTSSSLSLFVRLPGEKGDVGGSEHYDTPEEAATNYLDMLKCVEYFYVTMQSLHDNKHIPVRFFKWDGNAFVIIEKPEGYSATADEAFDQNFLTVEQMVEKIETLCGYGNTSGTNIVRVMAHRNILDSFGLEIPPGVPKDKESYLIWSVAVGQIRSPKAFFYGWSIIECLQKALKALQSKEGLVTEADKLDKALQGLRS